MYCFSLFTGRRSLGDSAPKHLLGGTPRKFLREKHSNAVRFVKKKMRINRRREWREKRSNFEYKCKLVSRLITTVDTSRAMRLAGLRTFTFFSLLAKLFGYFSNHAVLRKFIGRAVRKKKLLGIKNCSSN